MSTNDVAFLMRSSREANVGVENKFHKDHLTLTRAQYIESGFVESYLHKWLHAYSKRLMALPSRYWVQRIYINLWSPREFDQLDAIGKMTYILSDIVKDNRAWDARGLHKDMWQIQRDLMQYGFYRRVTMLLRSSERDLERYSFLISCLYHFVDGAGQIRVTLRGARRDQFELSLARWRARALMQQLKPQKRDYWNVPIPTKANEIVRHNDTGELLAERDEEEEETSSSADGHVGEYSEGSSVLVIASQDMANPFLDLVKCEELLILLLEYMSTNDVAFLKRSSTQANFTLTRAQYIESHFDESYLYKWLCAYAKRLISSHSRHWVQRIYLNLWSPLEFDQINAIGYMTYILNDIVRDNRAWDAQGVGLHKDMWQIQGDLLQYGFYRRATMLLRTSERDLKRCSFLVSSLYDFVEIAAQIRVTLCGTRRDKFELDSARCRARALMQQLKPQYADNWNIPIPTKAHEIVRHGDTGELLEEREEEEEDVAFEGMFEDRFNPPGCWSFWISDEATSSEDEVSRFEDSDELLTESEEEESE